MVALLKHNSESFKRSFLLILAYGLAFGLGEPARWFNSPVKINFYLSEQNRIAFYVLNIKDILDLIFIGPVFTIISFILLKRILEDFNQNHDLENMEVNESFYYSLYLIAVVIFNYGNIIHVLMNRLNAQIITEYNDKYFYYYVYFLDEFIGHFLITLGFFIIFCEMCILHTINLKFNNYTKNNEKILLENSEHLIHSLFGIALGVATALTYLEGQCAFFFLVANTITLIFLILFSKTKRIRFKENSLLILFTLMTITFSLVVITWAFIFGIKPYYPYYYQISEVR